MQQWVERESHNQVNDGIIRVQLRKVQEKTLHAMLSETDRPDQNQPTQTSSLPMEQDQLADYIQNQISGLFQPRADIVQSSSTSCYQLFNHVFQPVLA